MWPDYLKYLVIDTFLNHFCQQNQQVLFETFDCGSWISEEGPSLFSVGQTDDNWFNDNPGVVLLIRPTEKLEGEKLNVAEVTQSEIAQKQKLQTVLERINDSLKLSTRSIRWNVDCEGHPD